MSDQASVVCTYSSLDGYPGNTSWVSAPVNVVVVKRRNHKVKSVGDVGDSEHGSSVTPCSDTKNGRKAAFRARAWCFTIPGHRDEDVQRLKTLKVDRLCVGMEFGKGGYAHLQGYVRFVHAVTFGWWKLQFPTTHVELRKGSESQATAYCRKDGNVLIDIGVDCDERYVGLDKETELQMVIDEFESGAKYGQVRDRHKHFFFWHRKQILDYVSDMKLMKNDPDFEPC